MKILGAALLVLAVLANGTNLEQTSRALDRRSFEKLPGVLIHEKLALAHVIHRTAVAFPEDVQPSSVHERVQLGLRVETDGCVSRLAVVCGDPDFVEMAIQSVTNWTFRAWVGNGKAEAFNTYLTFEWKNGRSGLIWDFADYPLEETDVMEILRAATMISNVLKQGSDYHLEVACYPVESQDGFYSLHMYWDSPAAGMLRTLGFYSVNAFTGEVWSETPEIRKLELPEARAAADRILRLKGLSISALGTYADLIPLGRKDPCFVRKE